MKFTPPNAMSLALTLTFQKSDGFYLQQRHKRSRKREALNPLQLSPAVRSYLNDAAETKEKL